jgi:hypothetical protein
MGKAPQAHESFPPCPVYGRVTSLGRLPYGTALPAYGLNRLLPFSQSGIAYRKEESMSEEITEAAVTDPEFDAWCFGTVDPRTGMPLLTTFLHRVCANDEARFSEGLDVLRAAFNAFRQARAERTQ